MTRKFLISLLSALTWVFLSSPANAVMIQFPAQGILYPAVWNANGPPGWPSGGQGNGVLNGATIKVAVVGTVFQKDAAFQGGTSKNIQSVSWSTPTLTCAGCTSVLQVSLQTVGTSGPPAIPSGTILASGNAKSTKSLSAVASNNWETSNNFTSSATVNYGDQIAVVWEFTSYDSGSTAVTAVNSLYDCGFNLQFNFFNGSVWANTCNMTPIIQLNFDDGTVGTLTGGQAFKVFQGPTADTFNSSSTPNEIGMAFTVPFSAQVDQLCAGVGVVGTTSSWTIELTDGAGTPNVLASVAVDPHTTRATGTGAGNVNQAMSCFPVAPVTLTRSTQYYLGVLATGAGNIATTYTTFNAASGMDTTMFCGQNCAYATRKGASWSATTTTRRLNAGVMISAMDDGTGSGTIPRHRLIETIFPKNLGIANDNEDFMPRRWKQE